MGEIKWTEKASSNLQSIFDYISRDSRLYAARYLKTLIIATKRLETMLRSGRIVPEFENPELRETGNLVNPVNPVKDTLRPQRFCSELLRQE